MLSYTKATLKDHLKTWVEGNGADADEDFVAALDEIIQRGEVRLAEELDLDSLDSVLTTTAEPTESQVWKPDNLINERLLIIDNGAGRKSAVVKRSRAWIEMTNADDTEGLPKAYAEYDELRWFVAPVSDEQYLIYVHGQFTPASITDGDDDNTTWFSTRTPVLLSLVCQSEAAQYLKFWNKKVEADSAFIAEAAKVRGITANLQRSDIEDIVGNGTRVNRATIPPEPAAGA